MVDCLCHSTMMSDGCLQLYSLLVGLALVSSTGPHQLGSFSPTDEEDNQFPQSPNFQQIFRGNHHQDNPTGLYKPSNKRQPPSKANRRDHKYPPMPKLGRDYDSSLPTFDPDHDMPPTNTGPSTRATRSKTTESNENDPGNAVKGNQIADKVPRKNDSKRAAKPPPLPTRETASPSGSVSKRSAAEEDSKELQTYLLEKMEADQKLSKSGLLKTVGELRRGNYIKAQHLKVITGAKNSLAKMYRELQDKYHVAKQEVDTIEAEHDEEKAQLKEKLDAALKDLKAARKKNLGVVVKVNKAFKKIVIAQAKGVLWSMCKFIQSEEEMEKACKLLFKVGVFEKDLVDTKEKRADLVQTYKVICKRAVFEKRNYVSSETKKSTFKRWWAGQLVLTVEDLLMCLKRDIKSDEDMTKFMLYHDEYLARAVGASDWNDKTSLYNTISRATRADNPQLPLITPEDEAFCVLCVHNSTARWEKEFQEKKARADAGHEVDEDAEEEKKCNDGLFTRTTTGQNHWGGWTSEGLELFKEYRVMNIEARKDPRNDQLEKDCLQRLRRERGIEDECTSALEHMRNKEAKKRMKKRGRENDVLPPKKKVVHTLVFPDSSDDDDDGGSDSE